MSNHEQGSGFRGVPARPNNSLVQGEVLGMIPVETQEGWSVWQVIIHKSERVGELPNFTSDYIGETIDVYVNNDMQPVIADGRLVGNISYIGDEKGGRFFLQQLTPPEDKS